MRKEIIRRYLPEFLKPIDEREVIPGITFGQVKLESTKVGIQEPPRGILRGADLQAWSKLIDIHKEQIGMTVNDAPKQEEVLEVLSRVYKSYSQVTKQDADIYIVMRKISQMAKDTAVWHQEVALGSYNKKKG